MMLRTIFKTRMLSLLGGTLALFASTAVSRADLIDYYSFDGTTSAALTTDNSGHGLTLTARGTTGPAPSTTGHVNGSAAFSGSNDFDIATGSVYPTIPNFSTSFSVEPSSNTGSYTISRSTYSTGGLSFLTPGGKYYAYVYGVGADGITGSGIIHALSTSVSISSSGFDNMVVTYSDPTGATDTYGNYLGTASFFINGGVGGTGTTPNATASNIPYSGGAAGNDLGIGGRDNGGAFAGLIDEFATYNQVLTASQIVALDTGSTPAEVTPEPSCLALLGLSGLLLRRLRRQSSHSL